MANGDGSKDSGNANGDSAINADTTGTSRTPFSGEFVVNPGEISGTGTGTGATDEQPKRRGRPKGSTNSGGNTASRKTAGQVSDLKGPIKDLVLLIHGILLTASQIPEFAMADDEAEKIATLSANVARHYDIAQQSQKAIDWVALIGGLGVIYGTRAVTYNLRTKHTNPPVVLRPVNNTNPAA